ncbi:MAG: YebC/PmpR family DNA-binding transcriptional regulator [Erysipelotrichales bacterium]|nr:YebC/PmpR family DNA-binding transcriptional regulator [Erysipelotrichales bacterium]
MGRAHEVRAASMAATAAKKSALCMRASKEIYMAAKSGVPDPVANLALKAAIEKYKGQNLPKDVITRAIEKAKGGSQESYIQGRFEGFGAGNVAIIIDTLSDNSNRAYVEVKTAVGKKGGHLGTPGSVSYNFTEAGLLIFKSDKSVEEIEELLIMSDVDVTEVSKDEEYIEVHVAPTAFGNAKSVLADNGITEFDKAEISMLPNDYVKLTGEDLQKFKDMLDLLDDCQDVQEVYHNCDLSEE